MPVTIEAANLLYLEEIETLMLETQEYEKCAFVLRQGLTDWCQSQGYQIVNSIQLS